MRTLIYSALFGKLRICRKLIPMDMCGAECVLYTDRERSDLLVDNCWKVITLRPWANALTMVKIVKSLPMYLGDYDRSVWIDANVRCRRPLLPVFDMMGDADIACFQHLRRNTADDEAKHCAQRRVDDVRRLNRTAAGISLAQFPLYWCGMLWRKHTPQMIDFGLRWMMKMFMGTKRDQVTMSWAAQAAGLQVHVMSRRSIGKRVMVHNKR